MSSPIRETLKRSPLMRRAYRAGKRIAHSIFPPDQSVPAAPERAGAPAGAALVPGARQAVVSDFDIYNQYPPHVFYTFPERDAVFRDALKAYTNVSVEDEPSGLYSDPNRVLNFYQLVSAANKLPDGDYIELGSHRGFSLRVIHRFMDPSRTLYSFDTFEGFSEQDIEVEKSKYDTSWGAGSFAPTSVARVAHYVGDGAWPDNLKIVKGWFPESFRGLEDVRWRFVHIDFDLYQPIKAALETLWEPLLPGGIMMIHDYGCYGFPGSRMAVDAFCESIGQLPIELSDRWSTAVIRKPLTSTRG